MLDVAFACERTVTANEPRKVACTHTMLTSDNQDVAFDAGSKTRYVFAKHAFWLFRRTCYSSHQRFYRKD